jgi:hypothetical protein
VEIFQGQPTDRPPLRRLFANLFSRRRKFDPGQFYAGFVTDRETQRPGFSRGTTIFPCQYHIDDALYNYIHSSTMDAIRPYHMRASSNSNLRKERVDRCCTSNFSGIIYRSGFGGLGVSVLASGTQVRGFKPGRSRRIFKGGKILSTPSFGREEKPWVPCSRFAACKRSLKCTVEVGI